MAVREGDQDMTIEEAIELQGCEVSEVAARPDLKAIAEAKLATGPISPDEARKILSRFNASHWNNKTEHARYSIPANPRFDDDIRLDAFIDQSEALAEQITSCQERNTALVEENRRLRAETIAARVRAFHEAMRLPIATVPAAPSDGRVRLRLRLIAEEFFELLRSSFGGDEMADGPGCVLDSAEELISSAIESDEIRVDLPQFADALADIAYVVEGSNLEFGIDGEKVMAEVQRSNMAKVGGPVRADGKVGKPAGWTPPDIVGVLRSQGWREEASQ